MNSFFSFFSSAYAAVSKNPFIALYVKPVVVAVVTGSPTITLPEGVVTVTQAGSPARFTLGSAGLALETFLLTNQTEIQIGATQIGFVSHKALPVA